MLKYKIPQIVTLTHILPFFACLGKNKKSRFCLESGFYYFLLFFKVVPPGIELYLQVAVYHYFSEMEKG